MKAHISLHEGVISAGATPIAFRHNDPQSLDRALSVAGPGLVAVDGLYSTDGDIAPLAELVEVCERRGAALAGFSAVLDIFASEDWRRTHLNANHAYLKNGLDALGYNVEASKTQIIALERATSAKRPRCAMRSSPAACSAPYSSRRRRPRNAASSASPSTVDWTAPSSTA
jgi:7-keto-8-aminopelargonate synthetase-like enzyme